MAAKCCLRVATDRLPSPSMYCPTSLGVIWPSSRQRASAHCKNFFIAIRYAERVCALRILPKKNSSVANTAADPARERINGNWLGREEGRLAGTSSVEGLEVRLMGAFV